MTPREKVLKDALQQVQDVWWAYWNRPMPIVVEALAAADAIPDAPSKVENGSRATWHAAGVAAGRFSLSNEMKALLREPENSGQISTIPDAPVKRRTNCACGHDHLLHPSVAPDGRVTAGGGDCIELVDRNARREDFDADGPWVEKCSCKGPCSCSACTAKPIPDAPVATTVKGDCGHCGGSWPTTQDVLKHFRETNCGAAAPKPVPSRAELIELMWAAWLVAGFEHVLDALIKAGAVRT
jgi:hypothetical protein